MTTNLTSELTTGRHDLGNTRRLALRALAAATIVGIGAGALVPAASAATERYPMGSIHSLARTSATNALLTGRAADPDRPTLPVLVEVTVSGQHVATTAAKNGADGHDFAVNIPVDGLTRQVCATAIGRGPSQLRRQLGCQYVLAVPAPAPAPAPQPTPTTVKPATKPTPKPTTTVKPATKPTPKPTTTAKPAPEPQLPREIVGEWRTVPGADAPLPGAAGRAACSGDVKPGWRVRILKVRPVWTMTTDAWETYRNEVNAATSFTVTQETEKTVSATLTAGVETSVKAPLIAEAKVKVEASVSGSYTVKKGVQYNVAVPANKRVKAAIGVESYEVTARAYYLNRCGKVTDTEDKVVGRLPFGKGMRATYY